MKTKIHFKIVTPTEIKIMSEGKEIGQIWSQEKSGTLPFPHTNEDYDSIQICGFDNLTGQWGCGKYEGKRDLVIQFEKAREKEHEKYFKGQAEEYLKYLKDKTDKKEVATIQNFHDFCHYNIGQFKKYI